MSREIDVMIPKLARAVPLEPTVAILNPVIATGEFPTNLCALKFLTEITESQGQNITEEQLDQMMPHIARVSSRLFFFLIFPPCCKLNLFLSNFS